MCFSITGNNYLIFKIKVKENSYFSFNCGVVAEIMEHFAETEKGRTIGLFSKILRQLNPSIWA